VHEETHPDGLMRALLVVALDEPIEFPLLLQEVVSRWAPAHVDAAQGERKWFVTATPTTTTSSFKYAGLRCLVHACDALLSQCNGK